VCHLSPKKNYPLFGFVKEVLELYALCSIDIHYMHTDTDIDAGTDIEGL